MTRPHDIRPIALTFVLLALIAAADGTRGAEPRPLMTFGPGDRESFRLHGGAALTQGTFGRAIEFTNPMQYAEAANLAGQLNGVDAITIGLWVMPRRVGEQYFLFRGVPETAPGGERTFRPAEGWVNFVVGTDQHGFLMGTINGNGSSPFPYVTCNEVPIDSWSQLVVVKTREGFHRFYRNGRLVHDNADRAAHPGPRRPFREEAGKGEPVRLAVPLGGLIGEAWVVGREMTAEEIAEDFRAKRDKYRPALEAEPVELRRMDEHPAPWLWKHGITKESWPAERERILKGVEEIVGEGETKRVEPQAEVVGADVDCRRYVRRKMSILVAEGDRMPFYLLIPKGLEASGRRAGAIVCFYGTTSGAGKETTVGLSGGKPGSPPEKNRAFAIDMAEAGFVAVAPDWLRDGERVPASGRPYETTDFYRRYPDWSVHGKDAWDTSRLIDYLVTLPFIDPERIGMVGHSYGGHSTIFTTALEPRIKAAVANGPVSDFVHHGMHWAVPRGGGASQSMPNLRPYVLDPTRPLPATFYEFTSLVAPRPLLVGQAVGERRPMEEENAAAVGEVYRALGGGDRVKYVWYPGDHDFPPAMRRAAVEWFKRWIGDPN